MDPVTGRGRRRTVDIGSEDYQVARRYMVRLERADFKDAEWVAKLATAAGMAPEDFRKHFARLAS
jgi:ATP-dependent phosphofructokinase / diphosphate-dependent phosphofructokinase